METYNNLIQDSNTTILSSLANTGSAIGAEVVSIWSFSANERQQTVSRQYLWSLAALPSQEPSYGLHDVIRENKKISENLNRNIPVSGSISSYPDIKTVLAQKTLSFIIVPLNFNQTLWGALICEYPEDTPGMATTLSVLMEAAVQISSALQRKQDIERVRDTNAEYRSLLEKAYELVARVDEDGNVSSIGGHASHIDGYEIEDIIGQSFYRFIDQADWEKLAKIFAEFKNSKRERVSTDFRMKARFGVSIWARCHAYPVYENTTYKGFWIGVTDLQDADAINGNQPASENFYSAVLENINNGIIVLDGSNLITYFNSFFHKIKGFSRIELQQNINLALEALAHQNPLSDMDTSLQKAEQVFQLSLGEELETSTLLEVHASPMFDATGTMNGTLCIARDITQQHFSGIKQREAEHLYKYLISNIKDVLCCYDNQGTITFISDNITDLAGYTPEEIIGKSGLDFMHSDFHQQQIENIARLNRGESGISEYRMRHKDGSYIWVRLNCKPIMDENNQLKEVISIMINIDTYKEIEQHYQKAEQAENVYQQIIEQMPSVVWVVDEHLITRYVSPSIKHILGYTQEEALRMEMGLILKRDSFKQMIMAFDEALEAAKQQDKTWYKDLEIWQKRSNGRIIKGSLRMSLLFKDDQHIGILGITTMRKKGISTKKLPED